MSGITGMIDKIMAKDYAGANGDFNTEMATRLETALDQEKTIVAGEIYNDLDRVEISNDGDVDEVVREEFTDEEIDEFISEMTDEEAEEICVAEGVETLDEISGATLGSYIVKARKDQNVQRDKAAKALANKEGEKAFNTAKRKMYNRSRGERDAISKVTGSFSKKVHATEDTQLDELSSDTLASYASKSSKDFAKRKKNLGADGQLRAAQKRKQGVNRAIDKLSARRFGK